MRVFLGGTCNGSPWRDRLIPQLEEAGIDYFNPVVEDWTPECQEQEREERESCDVVLYVITPLMSGVYSIAEVVEDAVKRPERTVFCVRNRTESAFSGEGHGWEVQHVFSEGQRRSLEAVADMVVRNGASVVEWRDLVNHLKEKFVMREITRGGHNALGTDRTNDAL